MDVYLLGKLGDRFGTHGGFLAAAHFQCVPVSRIVDRKSVTRRIDKTALSKKLRRRSHRLRRFHRGNKSMFNYHGKPPAQRSETITSKLCVKCISIPAKREPVRTPNH